MIRPGIMLYGYYPNENLKKLVPNERKKDIQDLDNRLNPITINKLL